MGDYSCRVEKRKMAPGGAVFEVAVAEAEKTEEIGTEKWNQLPILKQHRRKIVTLALPIYHCKACGLRCTLPSDPADRGKLHVSWNRISQFQERKEISPCSHASLSSFR